MDGKCIKVMPQRTKLTQQCRKEGAMNQQLRNSMPFGFLLWISVWISAMIMDSLPM